MNQVPTRREMKERFERVDRRLEQIDRQKADKADVERVDRKINVILEGMDARAKQLNELSMDMKAVSSPL